MRKSRLMAACGILLAGLGAGEPITQPATVPSPTTNPTTIPTTLPTTSPTVDADSPLSADQVKQWIADLSNDSWQTRQQAQERLVRMGDSGQPVVRQLLREASDTEARARLQTAQSRIEENRVTGASYITLHVKNATPKEVFAELSKQCYTDLKPFPENLFDQDRWPSITLDIDHQPFWEALRQITEKTGVDLQQYSDGFRLMRGGGFRGTGPSIVEGPFLLVATQISRSQTISLARGGGMQSDFSIQFLIYSEPKLHVLSAASSVKLDEAVDNKGNSLLPDVPEPRGYYGGGGGTWNLMAQLKYPEHPGDRIPRLRGSTSFTVQTRSERLEVSDILSVHELTRTTGGLPVVIHEMKKNGAFYELRVSITKGLNDTRWNEVQQSVYQRLKVYDTAGQTYDYRGMSSRASNAGMEFTLTVGATHHPDGHTPTEPSKLVWEIPTASKTISVPFEFKDLPMPK